MKSKTHTLLGLAVLLAAVLSAPAALARPDHVNATTVKVKEAVPSEFSFTLSTKTVKHGTITFKITNESKAGLAHDFKLCSKPTTAPTATSLANACAGKGTATIGQGQSATLTVTVTKPGNYEYLCTVPGHAAGGMKGILKVT
jgi:uncharacterized cupredoxin-like copper-binding protein